MKLLRVGAEGQERPAILDGNQQARDLSSVIPDINGERLQDGNTITMVFNVKTIVAYLSQFMTLEAGDVIMTGTPPGVSMGQSPQKYLKAGDTVRTGIEGLGEQHQLCIDA